MIRVLSRMVDTDVALIGGPVIPSVHARVQPPDHDAPLGALTSTPVPSVEGSADNKPGADWSGDFADCTYASRPAAQLAGWWQENTVTAYTGQTQRLTSKDEWTLDFLAELGVEPPQVPENSPDTPSTKGDWTSDFAPPAESNKPDTSGKGWGGDFETNT